MLLGCSRRARLFLVLVSVCVLVQQALSDGVCMCECCSQASCMDASNGTYVVNECDACSMDECVGRYDACQKATTITAKCLDRGAFLNQFVIALFLLCTSTLILLGMFKDSYATKYLMYSIGVPGWERPSQ